MDLLNIMKQVVFVFLLCMYVCLVSRMIILAFRNCEVSIGMLITWLVSFKLAASIHLTFISTVAISVNVCGRHLSWGVCIGLIVWLLSRYQEGNGQGYDHIMYGTILCLSQVWHIYLSSPAISVVRRLRLDRPSSQFVVVGYIIVHYSLNYYFYLLLKNAFCKNEIYAQQRLHAMIIQTIQQISLTS